MRWKWIISLIACIWIVSCGKNEGIRPVGVQPPPPPTQQAPPPPNGGYYPPGGGGSYPPGGYPPAGGGYPPMGGYPPAYFRPQMPQGYPPQYTPFIPIDNYMRRTPPAQPYWTQFWNEWTDYARRQRTSPYDFNTFWFEYCPTRWDGTRWADLYNYFDSNIYWWVEPTVSVDVSVDASYYWEPYQGMPWYEIDAYGYCEDYCF